MVTIYLLERQSVLKDFNSSSEELLASISEMIKTIDPVAMAASEGTQKSPDSFH